jgi:hypothetical protein
MPQRLGNFAATGVDPVLQNPLGPPGTPIPPGKEFNAAKDAVPIDPVTGKKASTPTSVQYFEAGIWTGRTLANGDVISNNPDDWKSITPGLAIKPLGPGCGKGNTGLPDNTPPSTPGCVG